MSFAFQIIRVPKYEHQNDKMLLALAFSCRSMHKYFATSKRQNFLINLFDILVQKYIKQKKKTKKKSIGTCVLKIRTRRLIVYTSVNLELVHEIVKFEDVIFTDDYALKYGVLCF